LKGRKNLNPKVVTVTGCCGFIGSNLVDRLLDSGYYVIGIDNLSTGKIEFIEKAMKNSNFEFNQLDLLTTSDLPSLIKTSEYIFHFAANADIRFGSEHTRKDLEQNTIVTFNVLEAMRKSGVNKIVFSSSGAIYGDSSVIPTPENAPLPIQTSFYGASKLASEGLITAFCENFAMQSWIFRFVSIVGPRYTHGHIFDFYNQLMKSPHRLKVLGNGKQKKSFLHVIDCISGILLGVEKLDKNINIINLGFDGFCTIEDSVKEIIQNLGLNPMIEYGIENKGWIGDNPYVHLDVSKVKNLGWEPSKSIQMGISDTVGFLKQNKWLLKLSKD
jgi:UDP-glucose 4-epimerase